MPGDRNEQATQHRRDKARKDGDILHSRELTAAAGTLAGVLALGMLGSRILIAWRGVFAGFLDLGQQERWEQASVASTLAAVRRLSVAVMTPVGIVMAAVAAASLMVGVVQTGGVSFHTGAIRIQTRPHQPAHQRQKPV